MIRHLLAIAAVTCSAVSLAAQGPRALTADDLFSGLEIQEVWIHINDGDLRRLRETADQNTFYTCDIEWRGLRVNNVGIRSRGGATRNGTKPAFQLDFDRYTAGQQFLGLKSLVLDNLWHDASMMKERLTMLLFQRMGLPAPRESHARVFIGSRRTYAGVYAITEDIDERFLAREFGEDSGYLFEYDRIDGYHFEDPGPSLDPFAARFKPKNHKTESMFALYAPIQDMVRAINEAPAENIEAAVGPFLDLDRVLTFIALENYLAEWDGFTGDLGMANFYLYRFAGSRRSELLVWDHDNTFTSVDFPVGYNLHLNVLTRKIAAVPGLRGRYLQRLLDVAAAADGWLAGQAEGQYRQIRESALADPINHPNDTFEAAAAFIRDFARRRTGIVRESVAQCHSQDCAFFAR